MFFLLSLLSFAQEFTYPKTVENYHVNNSNIDFEFYFEKTISKDSFYNEKSLLENFSTYSNLHNSFFRLDTTKNCGSDKLKIYVLSKESLNNRRLFPRWVSLNSSSDTNPEKTDLVGLFLYKENSSFIYLQKVNENRELYFAHEISHYWYRKRCNNVYNHQENEMMAMEFESKLIKYYIYGGCYE